MKTFLRCLVLLCGAAFCLVVFCFPQSYSLKIVPYPEGYRRWIHVKSAVVGAESPAYEKYGGIHHIYANPKAMEGLTTGRFPDGSVLVFDLLETLTKGGVTSEGSRRLVDVMHKDSKRFAKTGGWGFEEFRGDSRTERVLNEKTMNECFTCHAKQRKHDLVFSSLRQ